MAKRFTSKTIENARPKADRYELSDGGGPLRLVVYPSGRRAFIVRYRRPSNRKTAKLTFEPGWPQLSLHDARVAAAEAMKQLGKGVDPAGAKQTAKLKAMEAATNTVANVCARYLAHEGKKLRSASARESVFRRLIYPAIGDKPIDSIRRSDIFAMLDRIADRNGERISDVCLSTLRRVLNWYALRDDNFRSPIVPGMQRQVAKEHHRKRVLDDAEIAKLWAATADNTAFSALIRVLLLTGARRNEVARMHWDEIVEGVWTLPKARSKTKAEVVRPLSRAVLAILDGLPHIDGCPYPFTSNGITPIASFSGPKEKLDTASGVVGWRLHDLRRTARSLLSRCKDVSVDHAERVLGHALPGIRGTYDKYGYTKEICFAVEALAAQIETIIHPPEGEVIPMRRR